MNRKFSKVSSTQQKIAARGRISCLHDSSTDKIKNFYICSSLSYSLSLSFSFSLSFPLIFFVEFFLGTLEIGLDFSLVFSRCGSDCYIVERIMYASSRKSLDLRSIHETRKLRKGKLSCRCWGLNPYRTPKYIDARISTVQYRKSRKPTI